jgi:hypothetical protein
LPIKLSYIYMWIACSRNDDEHTILQPYLAIFKLDLHKINCGAKDSFQMICWNSLICDWIINQSVLYSCKKHMKLKLWGLIPSLPKFRNPQLLCVYLDVSSNIWINRFICFCHISADELVEEYTEMDYLVSIFVL